MRDRLALDLTEVAWIMCIYTFNEIVQGRLKEDRLFLDIQKAYDTVWHDGLWYITMGHGRKGEDMACNQENVYVI